MIEELKRYNNSSFFACDDITEKLQNISEISGDEAEEYLYDAICQIQAMAQNPYNNDCWRVLYNVLLEITGKE